MMCAACDVIRVKGTSITKQNPKKKEPPMKTIAIVPMKLNNRRLVDDERGFSGR